MALSFASISRGTPRTNRDVSAFVPSDCLVLAIINPKISLALVPFQDTIDIKDIYVYLDITGVAS